MGQEPVLAGLGRAGKKEPFASSRMRKKSASGVLASLSGSPYRKSTIRPCARCGLAGRPFCASCEAVQRRPTPRICGGFGTQNEFFRSLLGHWALTGSRQPADVTLILFRVANLAAALPDSFFDQPTNNARRNTSLLAVACRHPALDHFGDRVHVLLCVKQERRAKRENGSPREGLSQTADGMIKGHQADDDVAPSR
jgi:hypothetical protein